MPERVAKPQKVSVLMSIREDGRGISFFGDLHHPLRQRGESHGQRQTGHPWCRASSLAARPRVPSSRVADTLNRDYVPRFAKWCA